MDRLIFVYNANGGALNALLDAAHKAISPSTYECALCAVTYGAVSMRREWKNYVARLPYETRFFHRDEFRKAFPGLDVPLPTILGQTADEQPTVLVRRDQMRLDQSVAELGAILDAAIATHSGQRR